MLMGPDFYWGAWDYVQANRPDVGFAMQSNLLLYKKTAWFDVFQTVFAGRISTSFDPDIQHRTIRGDAHQYAKRFYQVLDEVLADGFRPMVIGTYAEQSAPLAMQMYEHSLQYGARAYPLRFNYRYPAGREEGMGAAITPDTYGQMLLALYDRWLVDNPGFLITPLDQMLQKTLGIIAGQCPWTSRCGGRFIAVEPNGDLYNCGEFADVGVEHRFGSLRTDSLAAALASPPATLIRRRAMQLPRDCRSCAHFQECEGGCARDAVLFERGMGGKFFYCDSWKMVFSRIKASIQSGEADAVRARWGWQ